jgi:hypothetical protein
VPQTIAPAYLPIPDSAGGAKDQRLRPGPDEPGRGIAAAAGDMPLGFAPSCAIGRAGFAVAADGRVVFGSVMQSAEPAPAAGPCAVFSNTDGIADTNF